MLFVGLIRYGGYWSLSHVSNEHGLFFRYGIGGFGLNVIKPLTNEVADPSANEDVRHVAIFYEIEGDLANRFHRYPPLGLFDANICQTLDTFEPESPVCFGI